MLDTIIYLISIYAQAGLICVAIDLIGIVFQFITMSKDEFFESVYEFGEDEECPFPDNAFLIIIMDLVETFVYWPKFLYGLVDLIV